MQLVNLVNLRPSDKLDLLRLRDTREVSFKANFAFEPNGMISCFNVALFLVPAENIS